MAASLKLYKVSLANGAARSFTLVLPTGATVLRVRLDGLTACVWAQIDPTVQTTVTKTFSVVTDGDDVTNKTWVNSGGTWAASASLPWCEVYVS